MTTAAECPFAEGDRVQDRFGWPEAGVKVTELHKRLGRVVSVQRGMPNGKGEHGWSIAVQWDGSTVVSHGYTGATLIRIMELPPVMLIGGAYKEKS